MKEATFEFLQENPILILFLVSALGFLLGRVKIGKSQLGVAAVMFVGLVVGGMDPRLKLPDFVTTLGLVIMVYSLGLSSGPQFRSGLRTYGWKVFVLTVLSCLVGAFTIWGVGSIFRLTPEMNAGIFCGALTSTPSLAGVVDYLKMTDSNLAQMPVVGYSLAYPLGLSLPIVAIALYANRRRDTLDALRGQRTQLSLSSIEITNPEFDGKAIKEVAQKLRRMVVFTRIRSESGERLASGDDVINLGDHVNVVGRPDDIAEVAAQLGMLETSTPDLDRMQFDMRRLLVSKTDVVGKTLAQLSFPSKFGVVVTRIRRGDQEFIPTGNTKLQFGDGVRVVGPPENIQKLSKFVGDSFRAAAEIDLLTFSLGIVIGVLVGSILIPLPGGVMLRLGASGGALLVALFLGSIYRTGKLVWVLPYSAGLTLRQIGMTFFFAGIGTGAGGAFFKTLMSGQASGPFLAGLAGTVAASVCFIYAAAKLLGAPAPVLMGLHAGFHTQPAALAYANAQTETDEPIEGYVSIFPIAMVTKLLLAQAIVVIGHLLSRA